MMYMGGKNKLNNKDLQIHESNRNFHPLINNAIFDRTMKVDAFDSYICISNADHTNRYDKSKQKTSTFEN